MIAIGVPLGDKSYDVVIGDGLLDNAGDHVARIAPSGRLFIVADEAVWKIHGERLLRGLGGRAAEPILVAPGEASKSWAELQRLVGALLDAGIERRDHVLAFGGGVVGDLAGFAACIVKRGCGLIQVPTSLLAQVDSSVGGKTAINVAAGKNLVGAFHQPALVLIDPSLLDTLSARELRAGYAEVVKYGLLGDRDFFGWCEAQGPALLAGDSAARSHAIATCVAAKAAIVAADEQERNDRRALLNLGHTFGHALEAETGFSDRLLHGEAVAAGMALAFRYSVRRGHCERADAERVEAHLRSVGLPTGTSLNPDRLVARMRQDKKAEGGTIPFILARGIGRAFVDREVDLGDIRAFLEEESA